MEIESEKIHVTISHSAKTLDGAHLSNSANLEILLSSSFLTTSVSRIQQKRHSNAKPILQLVFLWLLATMQIPRFAICSNGLEGSIWRQRVWNLELTHTQLAMFTLGWGAEWEVVERVLSEREWRGDRQAYVLMSTYEQINSLSFSCIPILDFSGNHYS